MINLKDAGTASILLRLVEACCIREMWMVATRNLAAGSKSCCHEDRTPHHQQ